MKIKIPSQSHTVITNEAFERDVEGNSTIGNNDNAPESNEWIGVMEFDDGTKGVYEFLPIRIGDSKYFSSLGSPTHLFLSTAIEMNQIAEERKYHNFPECGTKSSNSNIHLLKFEKGFTHECYNDYLKARITSIVMLVTALENFMNQVIPADFSCTLTINGKPIEFKTKKEIESPKAYFKLKIERIIPLAIKQENFWEMRKIDLDLLLELYELRKVFIHLKTKSDEEWKRYLGDFAKMIEFDISKAIDTTIRFMNAVEKNFIVIEEAN